MPALVATALITSTSATAALAPAVHDIVIRNDMIYDGASCKASSSDWSWSK